MMDFLSLAIRAAIPSDTRCNPITFKSYAVCEWTTEEKQRLFAIVQEHDLGGDGDTVDPMYNNWLIIKDRFGFSAKRATWEFDWTCGKTAEELAEKMERYYNRN